MSLANWVITDGPGNHSLTSSSPIEGTSSLFTQGHGSTGSNPGGVVAMLPVSNTLTIGRFRTLFKVTGFTANSAKKFFGLCTMKQPNGAFYIMGMETTASAYPISAAVKIMKNISLPGDYSNPIATGSTVTINDASEVHAFEMEWQYDQPNGVTAIFCRHGNAINYSDLSLVCVTTDASSPFGSSLGCGFYCLGGDENTTLSMYWDKAILYKP